MEFDVKKFKKGTTTVGILCSDGVILGAEKRAVMGSLIANKDVRKIIQIQPHIGLTMAGSVADAQMIGRVMKAECALYGVQRKRLISVEGAATLLANILQYNKYFPYWVQLLMAGYDDKPRLYSLDAVGSMLEEKITSTGSGSPVAYGVLEDRYVEKRQLKNNIPIVVKAIKSAMERDAYSGNGMDIATITKRGISFLKQKEIDQILKK